MRAELPQQIGSGKQVHVTNNGCDFRWHAGATVEMDVVGGYKGSRTLKTDIEGGAGTSFEVD